MSGGTIAILVLVMMFVMMALRTPIAISMFVAGSVGYVMQTGWAPYANFMNGMAFARFASYDLSVIPLFILMGQFATQGGISKALFEFTAAITGGFKGGLAMAAVMASAAFGAICGSSVATAATITGVALAYLIAGHERHHQHLLRTRYLPGLPATARGAGGRARPARRPGGR